MIEKISVATYYFFKHFQFSLNYHCLNLFKILFGDNYCYKQQTV